MAEKKSDLDDKNQYTILNNSPPSNLNIQKIKLDY